MQNMEEEKTNLKSSQLIVVDTHYAIEPNLVIYKTFSIISWILLLYFSWKAFVEQNTTYSIIYILNFGRNTNTKLLFLGQEIILPFLIKLKLYHTFITVLIIFGFINYIIFTMLRPNIKIDEGLFGKISKFHFIPLLLVSAIFILMENVYHFKVKLRTIGDAKYYEYEQNELSMNWTIVLLLLIFSVLAFISLFIVYIKTDLGCNYILLLSVKKGVYSSLLVLLLHNIGDFIISFLYINLLKKTENDSQLSKLEDYFELSNFIASPIFGVIIIVFSFVCKDVVALFNNILIYIGMLLNVLANIKLDKNGKIDIYKIPTFEIIIDCAIFVFSFAGLFFFSCSKLDTKLIK